MEMINQLEEPRLSGSRYFILMVESDRVTYLQGEGKSNDSLSDAFQRLSPSYHHLISHSIFTVASHMHHSTKKYIGM